MTQSTRDRPRPVADPPAQQVLPFDDEADRPVRFALTARAKLAVAPEDLPHLSVVRDQQAVSDDATWPVNDEPGDTRPSRARALRRAGLAPAVIADQLGVDRLLVRAWIDAVAPVPARPARSATTATAAPITTDAGEQQATTAFELSRAAACQQAREDLLHDPGFAAGLGLLTGIVELDRHAVTVTTCDQEVATAVLGWLDEHLPVDPPRVRLVLQLGPEAAGDLAAHRWASRLGITRDRVAVARWRDSPSPEAQRALIRVADPSVAATVAGWRDALLAPAGPDPAGVAF